MNGSATEEFKSRVFVTNGAILIAFSVLISTPNGLLLYVMYKDPLKTFRNPTAVLVASLAITDFLSGCVTAVDVGIAHILEGLDITSIMLQAKIISQVTVRSSVLIMVLFSVERFLAVVYPFYYRFCLTVRTLSGCCLLCWVTALVTSLLELVIDRHLYDVIFLYAVFVLPLITVCLTYTAAYSVLKTRPKRLSQPNDNSNISESLSRASRLRKRYSERSARMEKKLMKTASLIVLVFVLSLLPFWTITIIGRYCKQCRSERWFIACYHFSIPVLYSNSGLNPLLYAWRMRQYRASLLAMFQGKEKRNRAMSSNCSEL